MHWKKILFLLTFFLLMFLIFSVRGISNPTQLPEIDEVIIVSGIDSTPDDKSKLVKYDEDIWLYAAVKSGENWYLGYPESSLPEKIKIKGKIHSIENDSLKRWEEKLWGSLKIKWYKIMPKPAPSYAPGEYKWYSNVITEGEYEGKWRGFDIIEYEQYPLKEEGWSFKPEREIGTVRFRAEVVFNGKIISSPGRPDPTHPSGISAEDYEKGIKDTVHRISRLSNHPNPLIRYIEALKGVPWCWGTEYRDSPKNTPSQHQSDFSNPVAIECSDLVISALRAMGNEKLDYTSAEDLSKGRYTLPVGDGMTLTYSKAHPFKNWTPRGLSWSYKKEFYIYGKQKIQIRDEQFNLIREVKIKDPSFEFIDITISKEGKLYSIVQEGLERKVAIVEGGKVKELFIPEVKKSIRLQDTEYSSLLKINPSGIDVSSSSSSWTTPEQKESIYLLASDTIYIFDLEGKEVGSILLEGAYTRWTPTGSLSVEGKLFYVPVDNKKILVYNLEGKVVRTIGLEESILDAEVKGEKIATFSPFPLRVQLYNLDGSFIWDYTDRFLNGQGEEVRIKIGSSPEDLQIGDLIITTSPTYHTLLLYRDNGNHVFDSRDEVICAGHEGIEIRKASYFEGRKFILRRFKPEI